MTFTLDLSGNPSLVACRNFNGQMLNEPVLVMCLSTNGDDFSLVS